MRDNSSPAFDTGIDIVQVGMISRIVNRWGDRFLNRVWSPQEIAYCQSKQNPYEHFAARFAGKEAVSKALGLTWGQGIRWKEISIINDNLGMPKVRLSGEVSKVADRLNIKNIALSVSHCRDYAVASAMVIRESGSHRQSSSV